jgi:hypothetical protein
MLEGKPYGLKMWSGYKDYLKTLPSPQNPKGADRKRRCRDTPFLTMISEVSRDTNLESRVNNDYTQEELNAMLAIYANWNTTTYVDLTALKQTPPQMSPYPSVQMSPYPSVQMSPYPSVQMSPYPSVQMSPYANTTYWKGPGGRKTKLNKKNIFSTRGQKKWNTTKRMNMNTKKTRRNRV